MAFKGAYGHIQEFDPAVDSFSLYIERVELFFLANEVPENKKVPVFLSIIGKKTYSLVRDLMMPDVPSEKNLRDIIAVLKKHFHPTPSVIAERFQFHKRDQREGETVAEFVAELKRLSTHCKFENYLDDALGDRFVCGLRKEPMQKRLLAETDLTFAKAVEIAQGIESVDKQALAMKNDTVGQSNEVNKVCQSISCYRCGKSNHTANFCKYKDMECHNCGKRGHLKSVCRSKKTFQDNRPSNRHFKLSSSRSSSNSKMAHKYGKTKYLETAQEVPEEIPDSKDVALFTISRESNKPIRVSVTIGGEVLPMEVDTGAAVSLISEVEYQDKFSKYQLHKSNVKLKTYTSESMIVVGEFNAQVTYEDQKDTLTLVVVKGDGPALMGRNWLTCLKLNWHKVFHTSLVTDPVETLIKKYGDVFSSKLGTMTHKAKLKLKEGAKPKFWRPRTVPFALKPGIEKELDKLQSAGIIEPVIYSEWAAPIVPVPKKDGGIRVCGDYKVTLNPLLEIDQYPLPKPEELFTAVTGGNKFTKLDLSQAYQQILLDDDSKDLVTINTHRGLYRYTRLPFGIASAPAVFQRTMDIILQGIPRTICYIDQYPLPKPEELFTAFTGATDQEHISNLGEVLRRLKYHGITLKKEKCKFMCDSVEYLGHVIDAQGLHVKQDKVDAIVNAPKPSNVTELRAYLGLINYYGKFIPNLASILQPLNNLLKHSSKWEWSLACDEAVDLAREKLISSEVLTHYDPSLPIQLATDASQYGLGAVLSHRYSDGSEKPIAFASRSLSNAEKNYSQIEKEGLSIIFGIKKFNQYLIGREFTLITDHKPLTYIFGPKSGIPSLTAARLQRWALLLSAYHYKIVFRSTKAHSNADALSRLPLKLVHNESTCSEGASTILICVKLTLYQLPFPNCNQLVVMIFLSAKF